MDTHENTRVVMRGSMTPEFVDYAWTNHDGAVTGQYRLVRSLGDAIKLVIDAGHLDPHVTVTDADSDGIQDYTIEIVEVPA